MVHLTTQFELNIINKLHLLLSFYSSALSQGTNWDDKMGKKLSVCQLSYLLAYR